MTATEARAAQERDWIQRLMAAAPAESFGEGAHLARGIVHPMCYRRASAEGDAAQWGRPRLAAALPHHADDDRGLVRKTPAQGPARSRAHDLRGHAVALVQGEVGCDALGDPRRKHPAAIAAGDHRAHRVGPGDGKRVNVPALRPRLAGAGAGARNAKGQAVLRLGEHRVRRLPPGGSA